jgi:cytochrome P450
MVTTFNKHTQMLVAKWRQDAQTQACVTMAPAESMANLTFDVMAEAGFGLESNTKITGESAIREAFDALSEETNTRLADAFDWQQYLPWRYFPLKRQQAVIRRLANEVFDRRIKEKEEKRRLRAGSDIDAETRYARDLVDVLLDAFWDQVVAGDRRLVHEHAATFMIAGHETTSGALQWALYELARHPDVQQKCREEVRAVVGQDADVAYDHLQHLKYLQQVMKETLRMHPPVRAQNVVARLFLSDLA